MGEVIRTSGEYEPTFERQCDEIIAQSLFTIGRRYGTGLERSTVPPLRPLAYHNTAHTRRVIKQSAEMAARLGLSTHDVKLVQLIASAHDVDQEHGRGEMERRSADWLASEMVIRGMPIDAIDVAVKGVLGTEPTLTDNGIMINQEVNNMKFETDRERIIAQSVASGDMASLYAPISPQLSRLLYMEEHGTQIGRTPPMDDFLQFQWNQLELLKNYRYPHPAAEEFFGLFRPEVCVYQQMITKLYENGEMTGWSSVLQFDKQFAQQVG